MIVVVLVLSPKVPHAHLELGIRGGNGDELPLDVDSVGPLVSTDSSQPFHHLLSLRLVFDGELKRDRLIGR